MKNRLRFLLFSIAVAAFLATPAIADEPSSEEGKALFNKLCKSCHKLTEQMLVGPGLAGVTQRRSEEWIDKWITSPKAVLAAKDPDALDLRSRFKITMPTIDAMKDPAARKSIIELFKQNDSK